MWRDLFCMAVCVASAGFTGWAGSMEDLTLAYAQEGTLIVTQMVSAPYPHPERARGHTYQGALYPAEQHYQDGRVALFIPRHFRENGPVDFVVHLHGWRATLEGLLPKFRLAPQFAESQRNAILVVPQGPRDAPDSFGGKLEDPGGFKRFMSEVVQTLRQRGVLRSDELGDLVLSGHSGGYHAMAAILDRGGLTERIKEVYLFDALYGQTEKFVSWLDHGQGKLIAIYTAQGGTQRETERLIQRFQRERRPHLARDDSEVTAQELARNRIIFLFTPLDHDQVLYARHNFRDYLRAGGRARAEISPP